MSKKLIDFARNFIASNIDADEFADPYIAMWKAERNARQLTIDGPDVDEASSSLFCLADSYNPDVRREEYELDDNALRAGVKATLEKFNLLHNV